MRALITLSIALSTASALAQRPLLAGEQVVRDSVMAAITRDFAEGLWAEEMATGALKGLSLIHISEPTRPY